MNLEDCILLRDESIDSNSLNRCLSNLFNYARGFAGDNINESSENFPGFPFYKDGYSNAIDSSNGIPSYRQYSLSAATSSDIGVTERIYRGPLNIDSYSSEALSTESVSGTYVYESKYIREKFIPSVQSLFSPTYPMVFSSLLGDELASIASNGTCTLASDYFPTVKYTTYLLCSGLGISFGTITFDKNDGITQENAIRVNVIEDLIHLNNVDKIKFVSISNGYGSGVRQISENLDMVEDITECGVTFLDKSGNSILINSITKNDGGESIRVDKETGRILSDSEDAAYGTYVELDNTTYSLNFFIAFTYQLPDTAFTNKAFAFNSNASRVNYSKFMQNVRELNGEELTLTDFVAADILADTSLPEEHLNLVTDISYAFENCTNAVFPKLKYFSSIIRTSNRCFYGCTSATFESLDRIELGMLSNGSSMFELCDNATFDNLEEIRFLNASNISNMFRGCSKALFDKLSILRIAGNATGMFYGCTNGTFENLKDIYGNYSNITNMFTNCDNAEFGNIEAVSSTTSRVVTANSAFSGLSKATFKNLKTVAMGQNGYIARNMFEGCRNSDFATLESLSAAEGDTKIGKPIDATSMFKGCSKGTFSNLKDLGDKLVEAPHMFEGCESSTISITSEIPSLANGEFMFSGCSSVNIKYLPKSLRYGEHMFSDCKSVVIENFGHNSNAETNIDCTNMFKNSVNVTVVSGDIFANNRVLSGMFHGVNGKLELLKGSTDAKYGEEDFKNTTATNADYMFCDASSISAFHHYAHRLVPSTLTSAKYMFANSDANSMLFNGCDGTRIKYLFNGGVQDVNGKDAIGIDAIGIDAIYSSNIRNAQSMFENATFSKISDSDDAKEVFYNGEYSKLIEKSSAYYYSFHVPSGVVDGTSMFRNANLGVRNEADGTYSALLRIPSTLEKGDYMFENESGKAFFDIAFGGMTPPYDESDSVVYFSDALADNHERMFYGAKFSDMRGKTKNLALSVKDFNTDYFEGSDFTFDCFAHIIDRSGTYWKNGNKDFQFFAGKNESRKVTFSNLKDDVSKWFSEGVELATLFCPTKDNENDAYGLVDGVIEQFTMDGITRSKMKVVSNKMNDIASYTNDVTFDNIQELCGNNMTCMFYVDGLIKNSKSYQYFAGTTKITDGAGTAVENAISVSDYTSSKGNFQVYGNTLSSVVVSTNMNSTDSYKNNSYENATFDGLRTVSSVNMPFAFYALKSATFNNLETVGGKLSNSVCAFAFCDSASFSSLKSVDIDAAWNSTLLPKNSFTSSTNAWHGNYWRMFDGCTYAKFDSLSALNVRGTNSVVLNNMFRDTGLVHCPNINISVENDCYVETLKSYKHTYIPEQLTELTITTPNTTNWTTDDGGITVTRSGNTALSLSFELTGGLLTGGFSSVKFETSGNAAVGHSYVFVNGEYRPYVRYDYFRIYVNGVKKIEKTGTWNTTIDTVNAEYNGNKCTIKVEYAPENITSGGSAKIFSIHLVDSNSKEHIISGFTHKNTTSNITFAKERIIETDIFSETPTKTSSVFVESKSGMIKASKMLSNNSTIFKNISVIANGNVDANNMLQYSTMQFDGDNPSIVISSKSGGVNAGKTFDSSKETSFSGLKSLIISANPLAPTTLTSTVCSLFYNCSSATFESLEKLYLPVTNVNSVESYRGVFSGCIADNINLSALTFENTNISRIGYNGEKIDGSVFFSKMKNVDGTELTPVKRDDIISKLNLDKNIAFDMTWPKANLSDNDFLMDGLTKNSTVTLSGTPTGWKRTDEKRHEGLYSIQTSGDVNSITLSSIEDAVELYYRVKVSDNNYTFYVTTGVKNTETITVLPSESVGTPTTTWSRLLVDLSKTNDGNVISFSGNNTDSSKNIFIGGLVPLKTSIISAEYREQMVSWVPVDYITTNFDNSISNTTEYAKSAYIDTGISPSTDTTVELKFKELGTENGRGIFGFTNKSGSGDVFYVAGNGTTAGQYVAKICSTQSSAFNTKANGGISYLTFSSRPITSVVEACTPEQKLYVTSNIKNNKLLSIDDNMYIGAINAYYSDTDRRIENSANMAIYGCKILNGTKLVRDFIPVRSQYEIDSKTIYALFDMVTNTIFDSDSPRPFGKGMDYEFIKNT